MTTPEPTPATLSWRTGSAAAFAIIVSSAVTYPVMASTWVYAGVIGLWCLGALVFGVGWLVRKRVIRWLPRLVVTTVAVVGGLLSLLFTLFTLFFALTDF